MEPRGIRNRNPLNIRRSAQQWRGASVVQTDAEFVQFETMAWGLRAGFCLLRTYARRYGLHSPADIIGRWAPLSENRTTQYVQTVCRLSGLGGQQRLTERDWPRLVAAMVRVECGTALPQETINEAFNLYKKTTP